MVLDGLLPAARHRTDQYANNRIEADHGVLKSRLRPVRGLKQDRNARVMIVGCAFMRNIRRGGGVPLMVEKRGRGLPMTDAMRLA